MAHWHLRLRLSSGAAIELGAPPELLPAAAAREIGGMTELVRDGVDGLHAPLGNAEGFAALVARVVGDDGLWESLVG